MRVAFAFIGPIAGVMPSEFDHAFELVKDLAQQIHLRRPKYLATFREAWWRPWWRRMLAHGRDGEALAPAAESSGLQPADQKEERPGVFASGQGNRTTLPTPGRPSAGGRDRRVGAERAARVVVGFSCHAAAAVRGFRRTGFITWARDQGVPRRRRLLQGACGDDAVDNRRSPADGDAWSQFVGGRVGTETSKATGVSQTRAAEVPLTGAEA